MATTYILHNPKAGGPETAKQVSALELKLQQEVRFRDITRVTNYAAFLDGLDAEDTLILAGGDGTLNRFINDTDGLTIRQQILCYPCGTGNDFAHELGKTAADAPFPIGEYLKNLPSVRVNGKTFRFLNGIGYGIDGYCCEVGDELRKTPGKKVNYTSIAIKGLLFHYAPTDATITVDGVTHRFQKVWLAPAMHGKYYGGGMMPTPNQDRLSPDPRLSVLVFHGSGKLRTLMIFPSIFKGEHIRHTRFVEVLEGKEITVEFDSPRALQIDGETIPGVTSYTATAAKVPSPV
ncbi:MAG: diacylglycerol/lipid kinase family protein [Faecousia sp.]